MSLEENETRVCQRSDATLGLGSLSQNLERRVTRKKSGREKRGEKKKGKKKRKPEDVTGAGKCRHDVSLPWPYSRSASHGEDGEGEGAGAKRKGAAKYESRAQRAEARSGARAGCGGRGERGHPEAGGQERCVHCIYCAALASCLLPAPIEEITMCGDMCVHSSRGGRERRSV